MSIDLVSELTVTAAPPTVTAKSVVSGVFDTASLSVNLTSFVPASAISAVIVGTEVSMAIAFALSNDPE